MSVRIARFACVLLLMPIALMVNDGVGQEKLGRYSIYEAQGHVGEMASIRGSVMEVVRPGRGLVFLLMGDYHPDQVFTVVVPDTRSLGNAAKYEGSIIEVVGRISVHRGKPEIVLTSWRQIRYVEWAAGMSPRTPSRLQE